MSFQVLRIGGMADQMDFIGFQEMWSMSFPGVDKPDQLPLAGRALAFSNYLHETFHKPVFLAYVALSSYHPNGAAEGERIQARFMAEFMENRGALQANGVFGLSLFEYYDDPNHAGFFGPGEKHFGIITADGRKKPAYGVFRDALAR